MALDQALSPPLAIGIGCRRGVDAAPIAALIRRVTNGLDLNGARLFTLELKTAKPGLRDAAQLLGLPLIGLSADLLAEQQHVTIRSPRVAAAVGVASVAEAAALAGAGEGARLLLPRVAEAGVTCAVAVVLADAGGEQPASTGLSVSKSSGMAGLSRSGPARN